MGIIVRNIVKKERDDVKKPVVIGNYAEWRANLAKSKEQGTIETPSDDTKLDNNRQPSSEWLSIKDSDYVSHLVK